jgi:hypothetical protein
MKNFINNKSDFKKVLEQVIAQTSQFMEEYPEIGIYKNIYQQLHFIWKVIFEEKRKPKEEEFDAIMIGNMAVKNFENDYPEYGRKLEELDYYFEHYETL